METSPKLGPLNVSVPGVWLAVQIPNYKINFSISVPLTCNTDTGRE